MINKVKEAFSSVEWGDLFERAAWTFVQGFLAVFLLGLDPIIDSLFSGDWNALWVALTALLAGAVMAGLSALKTLVKAYLERVKNAVK